MDDGSNNTEGENGPDASSDGERDLQDAIRLSLRESSYQDDVSAGQEAKELTNPTASEAHLQPPFPGDQTLSCVEDLRHHIDFGIVPDTTPIMTMTGSSAGLMPLTPPRGLADESSAGVSSDLHIGTNRVGVWNLVSRVCKVLCFVIIFLHC
jgi:hypothetical protein